MSTRQVVMVFGVVMMMIVGGFCVRGAARLADNMSVVSVDQQLALLK